MSPLPQLDLGGADGAALWPQGADIAVPPDLLDVAKALTLEAGLLTPDWVSAMFAAKAGSPVDPKAIGDWLAAHGEAYAGTLPSSVGWKPWDRPWLPIMIHWELDYRPLQAPTAQADQPLDAQLVISRLPGDHDALDADHVDVALALAPNDAVTVAGSYQGITFLTPQAGLDFRRRIEDYAAAHDGSPLASLGFTPDHAAAVAGAQRIPGSIPDAHADAATRRRESVLQAH